MGFIPTSPQQAAGMRIEPPPSEAVAAAASPPATAAADPPEEPPQVRDGSQGLRVMPLAAVAVQGKIISSGTLVIPMGIAPAARRRRIGSASAVAGAGQLAGRVPRVATCPVSGRSSLTAIGTPASGPSGRPAASASASACSPSTVRKALHRVIERLDAGQEHLDQLARGLASPERTSSARIAGPAKARASSTAASYRSASTSSRIAPG